MTPAARYAAAIAVLDDVLAGASAEKCLTTWARSNRYAGSKDRAAVRDHVYDVLRQKRSLGALGGSHTGRGLVLGLIRSQGIDANDVFGGGGYGPEALTDAEVDGGRQPETGAEAFDMPDWLWPIWAADLGANAQAAAAALQSRGPVALRVNLKRASVAEAIAQLAAQEITAVKVDGVKTALHVVENERKVHLCSAYVDGVVELQDVASQAAVAALNIAPSDRVLDFCAGGGGKALAMADIFGCAVTAHDISQARMADIPIRAARAGVHIDLCSTPDLAQQAPFDAVFVDAPCSGSGTWRRAPEAKWQMTSEKLHNFSYLQYEVLLNAAAHVGPKGQLIYATCSVLYAENSAVIGRFLEGGTWKLHAEHQRIPDDNGDGFYYAVLHRA